MHLAPNATQHPMHPKQLSPNLATSTQVGNLASCTKGCFGQVAKLASLLVGQLPTCFGCQLATSVLVGLQLPSWVLVGNLPSWQLVGNLLATSWQLVGNQLATLASCQVCQLATCQVAFGASWQLGCQLATSNLPTCQLASCQLLVGTSCQLATSASCQLATSASASCQLVLVASWQLVLVGNQLLVASCKLLVGNCNQLATATSWHWVLLQLVLVAKLLWVLSQLLIALGAKLLSWLWVLSN